MQLLQLVTRPVVTVVAALSLALAACGDSTGPDAPFDAEGTNADIAATTQAFQSPAFDSYNAIAGQLAAVAGSGGAMVMPSSALTSRANAVQHARKMMARVDGAAGVRPNFDFAELAGTTFEYDPETQQYAPTERAGAPANGVRFILYSVNPVTGEPTLPLAEIGYAQLTVTESGTSATARLTVVSDGTTYLDYTASRTITSTSLGLTIKGFATNGVELVNFELAMQLTGNQDNGEAKLSYVLSMPSRNFRLSAAVSIQSASESLSLQFEARGDNGRLTLNGTLTNEGGTITVRVNGGLFATIVMEGSTTTVTGASGEPLTQEELDALEQAFQMSDGGFEFFDSLVTPTGIF